VIYVRHNPCSLLVCEEPIHNTDIGSAGGRTYGSEADQIQSCYENDKGRSKLVGHHLLGCLLDAMYDPYIPTSYQ
jgi:hypothetical protein